MNKQRKGRSSLIEREDSVLVIIDMQERLFPAMAEKEKALENVMRLARFSKIAGIPVVPTEQVKLGPTLPGLKEELKEIAPVSKMDFNCFGCEAFASRIKELNRGVLVLCGLEAHICVVQTALFAASDYEVQVVADAVASRSPENRRIALERMSGRGITVTSTEMVIYELLKKAGTGIFKEVLKLVK